ncbi:DUF3566 domain-containing protein [Hoyosella altamirensis]|uniref:DUF3566 domain-containing protein n=1 Tax=Hoyosella altamirensis TaxID=616997 RepID=A0A839RPY3_9ACTN|nr:DUF3566 domain-containing protein [Hoyosella altamirensis]MBB3038086.1 hypothetical protein [Hoyosella altamirensis]
MAASDNTTDSTTESASSKGAAQTTSAADKGKSSAAAPPRRRPPVTVTAKPTQAGLRAAVQIREIDPWSALKISAIISAALFLVWMIAVGTLYLVLEFMNVWDRLNSAFLEIVDEGAAGEIISAGQIFGWTAAIGFINMILFTALLTLASFIYNLASDLVGGIEVTLADRD